TGAEDPYFHGNSLEVMNFFSRSGNGRGCATVVTTDNFTPEVSIDYENGFYIPISTPFRLEGSATDANNDTLTYIWEQFDLGPDSPIGQPEGNTPLFRTFEPSEEGNIRYFPRLDRIVNNISSDAEVLPTYSRDLTFRLIARDNNFEAGGFDWEEVAFRSDTAAGPFLVNNPDETVWEVGEYQRITWEVANTDKAPVNCKQVNVLLSTDGGQTFDVVLASDLPNTGEAMITVPEAAITGQALLMIEAVDNIFLNVNDNFFQVGPATTPRFTLGTDITYANVCTPTTQEIAINSGNVLDFSNPISLSIEQGDNLEAAVFNLSATEINPGDNASLSADFTDVRYTGRSSVTIVAAAEGQDTTRYPIVLDVVDSDYSDLGPTSPEEGIEGVVLSIDFDWTDAVNADFYDIQIATSPTFEEGTIFEAAGNLLTSEYALQEFFDPNTIYFWRVRAGNNSCGGGDWLDPRSFRTNNVECTDYTATDTPRPLPGSGPAFTRESRIFIEDQGTISDVNLPNVDLRYNFVSVLTLTLESPAGTRVVLYDKNCRISTNRLDLGFDDDAPRDIACPPDDERVFVPEESLSAFNGENTFGDWILEVAIDETGGSAGSLQGWNIEFCADVAAVAPTRVNNLATEVPPLQKNAILEDKLQASSASFNNEDIKYTLTALPVNGRLLLYRNELSVGDEFFQDDINGAGLEYENTSGEEGTDDFGFIITTPDGGYLSIDYHDIIIDDNAVVSNRSVSPLEASLTAFPNPVASDLNIRWSVEINRDLDLELFDLNGRLLQRQKVAGAAKAAALNIINLPAGVYLLRIDGAVRRIVKQ
ncbi:MAG: T9SS type A sorting domain-containing protein, partial [Bacteroidota bacterium]